MNREYDIFEKLPDASLRCLTRVQGTLHLDEVLAERGKQTTNECFAMNVRTREVVARVNAKIGSRAKLIERLARRIPAAPVS